MKPQELRINMAFIFPLCYLDYIAECVDTFLTEQGLEDQEVELNLGYTFSFPVLQSRVSYMLFKRKIENGTEFQFELTHLINIRSIVVFFLPGLRVSPVLVLLAKTLFYYYKMLS